MKKKNIFTMHDYGLLFALSFTDFILLCFYILLSLVVIGDVSIISALLLLTCLFSAIYFIIRYQTEYNKMSTKSKKMKKRNKIYNTRKVVDEKTYNHSIFEEQL